MSEKPRLKNIDELFTNDTQPAYERGIVNLVIDELQPYPNHPFALYMGERLEDMVESIKTNGVLVPIIVRKVDDVLQILAGHNRVCAARLAGLIEVPAIVLENVTDDEAQVYVIETNVMQRGFSEMSHSEKAAVIALHHSKMFSQGKRNDIVERIKSLENPCDNSDSDTSEEIPKRTNTREALADEYKLSPNQVALYQRVAKLSDPLQDRLDNGEFALSVASELSFLNDSEQALVTDCIGLNDFKVDMKKAEALRSYSDDGKLDGDNVYLILSGEAIAKPQSRVSAVKIKTSVYTKYFQPDQSKKEVQAIVEQALELYFSQHTPVTKEIGGETIDEIFDSLPGEVMGGDRNG